MEIFQAKSVFPAYRLTKNLKEVLAPSKFRPSSDVNQTVNKGGCFKCAKIGMICIRISYFMLLNFKARSTGRQYPIRENVSCSSKNVIYLATCCKCDLQYVGSTSTEFKIRFRNHKSNMLNNRKTCELAVHFNSSQHDISQMSFVIIEQIISFQTPLHLEQLLLTNYSHLIRMALTKGANSAPKTVLITVTN